MSQSVIREETSVDVDGIRAVHEGAFGRDAEARLVGRLRSDGFMIASVVAVIEGEVVANAVFSRLILRTSSESANAVALAPVSVTPAYQRCGLGSQVIAYGLRLCAQRGYTAAFVLGHPAYYKRFGFSHDVAKAVRGPYSGAGEAWMALELRPSSISGKNAEVQYPDAFTIVH